MKAIVVREFGDPEVMKLEEAETPVPTGSQVLVRIYAAGVNPVETYLRTGIYPNPPSLPYTPGKDGAGVVKAVGEAVTRWKAGDRVYTANSITGTYAESSLCEEVDLGRLPDNVTFEQGAGIWTPYATAYRALFQKAATKHGETVLIHGASGGVGIAAIQWLAGGGHVVIGTASSKEGLDLILANGANAAFDHTDETHFAQIREFSDERGVDVIVEMLANVNLERDFECLAMRGRIVVVGSRGSLPFTPRLAMTKDATIFGMSLFNSSKGERDEIHAAIFHGLSREGLKPVIRLSIPLSEAASSHHQVMETKALGKIVLIP